MIRFLYSGRKVKDGWTQCTTPKREGKESPCPKGFGLLTERLSIIKYSVQAIRSLRVMNIVSESKTNTIITWNEGIISIGKLKGIRQQSRVWCAKKPRWILGGGEKKKK